MNGDNTNSAAPVLAEGTGSCRLRDAQADLRTWTATDLVGQLGAAGHGRARAGLEDANRVCAYESDLLVL